MSASRIGGLQRRWPAIALGVLVMIGALVVSGCGGSPLGIVDGRRLLNESVLALSYQKQLDDREKAMAADLRLLANSLSKEDLDARRAAYQQDLAKLKQSLEEQLNAEIRKSVAEVARKRRLRVILIQQSTILGGVDVTADVIERLK